MNVDACDKESEFELRALRELECDVVTSGRAERSAEYEGELDEEADEMLLLPMTALF